VQFRYQAPQLPIEHYLRRQLDVEVAMAIEQADAHDARVERIELVARRKRLPRATR
jgi:hypothetical protein